MRREQTLRVRMSNGEMAELDGVRGAQERSDFVRALVLEEIARRNRVVEIPAPVPAAEQPAEGKQRAPSRSAKCEHGVERGFNCWKCGGLAVIR